MKQLSILVLFSLLIFTQTVAHVVNCFTKTTGTITAFIKGYTQ